MHAGQATVLQAAHHSVEGSAILPRPYSSHTGAPLELVQPETLRWKVLEPVLLLGKHRFGAVDIRIRVRGGGHVSQIYAIRQAIAKGIIAFYQKCEQSCQDVHRHSLIAQGVQWAAVPVQ